MSENTVSKTYKYVALVTEIRGEKYITNLHEIDVQGVIFVAQDNTDKYGLVGKKNIIRVLPAPCMDNRERYPLLEPISEAT